MNPDKLIKRLRNLGYALETVIDALEEEPTLQCVKCAMPLKKEFDAEQFKKAARSIHTSALEDLIAAGKFDYINPDITAQNFPPQPMRDGLVVKHFNRSISSEDVVAEMDKEGLEPANLYELLKYAQKDWNRKDWVVALGSVYVYSGGYRYVPCLARWDARRELDLYYWHGEWSPDYRFLAARKSLEPQTLSPSALDTQSLLARNDRLIRLVGNIADLAKNNETLSGIMIYSLIERALNDDEG
jgi:hypothetical protein